MTGDAETLAEVLYAVDDTGEWWERDRRYARAILASDWLAAVRDEAARDAGAKALEADEATIEAMAQAIYLTDMKGCTEPLAEWETFAGVRADYTEGARAALAALRAVPPTEDPS